MKVTFEIDNACVPNGYMDELRSVVDTYFKPGREIWLEVSEVPMEDGKFVKGTYVRYEDGSNEFMYESSPA